MGAGSGGLHRGISQLRVRVRHKHGEHRIDIVAACPRRGRDQFRQEVGVSQRERPVHQLRQDGVVPRVLLLPLRPLGRVLVLRVDHPLVVPADREHGPEAQVLERLPLGDHRR